jgi:hypothetical protein
MVAPSYQLMNTLPEIVFIGGTEYSIFFSIFDENGSPIDISSSTCTWRMAYCIQPNLSIVTKTGTITGINQFKVTLFSQDTQSLSGKFVHQAIVSDFDGATYRPAQGIITIITSIGN